MTIISDIKDNAYNKLIHYALGNIGCFFMRVLKQSHFFRRR